MRCAVCNKSFTQNTQWQKFCSPKCKQRSYRHPCTKCGKPIVMSANTCQSCKPPSRVRDEYHFWSLVRKTEACWLWCGDPWAGYGRVTIHGKRDSAHRQSWRLAHGEIPNDRFVCHHCDVPLCVRPSHLFLGTQKDNMQDWTKKGLNKALLNGTLTKYGDEHWTRQPKAKNWRLRQSRKLRNDIQTGKRLVLRDAATGRIRGTTKFAY